MSGVMPYFFKTITKDNKRKIRLFKTIQLDGVVFVYTPDHEVVYFADTEDNYVLVGKVTFNMILGALGEQQLDD